jgi:two-component system, OmpR family, sensor kinase
MKRKPLRLRSVKNKLALLFFAITALAFALIFFYVVPQLTSNLEQQRAHDLAQVAGKQSSLLRGAMGREVTARELDRYVRATADRSASEVTLLGVRRARPGAADEPPFWVISNSAVDRRVEFNSGLATRALDLKDTVTSVSRDAGRVEAAVPLRERGQSAEWIAIYSQSLEDVADTVSLVGTEVLVATIAALLLSLFGGYLVARALARRVHRLELAAKGVAAGNFLDPIPVDSEDELGQLARTFNEMQRKLARLDSARREFIANASHELRTPIFSLGGFVELLQDEELDPETREEFLNTMGDQVARLQKLAVDLLDLSRLDADSLELSPEEVDLGELARDVAGEFRPALGQRHAELELRIGADPVEAWCDRARVAQIMRILLDNALTHTPDGTRVTVSAAQENGAAEFAVADSGPGVAAVAADHVFDRFYTADAARGSGLGLAIARELAERMDGEVTLRSSPGETVFTLALPASDGNGHEPAGRSAAATSA